MTTSRFAPSPTGRLHLGHAFSAARAHDFARERGGRFLLRIEDIDPGRTREEHVAGIAEDLAWLGLAWDGPVMRQSTRLDAYAAALGRLDGMGLIYPCTCTRAEIAAEVARSASAPHEPSGFVYPGTCRDKPRRFAFGDLAAPPAAWRLRMAEAATGTGPLRWWDERAGWVMADAAAQGDVVLARKDTPASYHLAVTIDDATQAITDVVRGHDLFEATHVHRLLQALLGLPTTNYRHHPLLRAADGQRLSKRAGARSLADLRAGGADAAALLDRLRQAGTGPAQLDIIADEATPRGA